MRTAPAQPMHDTDQESSWWRGTVWSLARRARTDWWKTIRERSTKTPVEETEDSHRDIRGRLSASNILYYNQETSQTLKSRFVWLLLLTRKNKADRRRLEEEQDLFTERHRDAYGPHHHQEQAEQGQHGCRYIQICTGKKNSADISRTPGLELVWRGKAKGFWGTFDIFSCLA